jgi:5'-3' exonuclease
MAKPRTVLIDGSSLAYRAFFALPATLRTPAGLPTRAIYGFARMFHDVHSRSTTA